MTALMNINFVPTGLDTIIAFVTQNHCFCSVRRVAAIVDRVEMNRQIVPNALAISLVWVMQTLLSESVKQYVNYANQVGVL